jgi:branched-chain amino acid transport system substrate-binding protein
MGLKARAAVAAIVLLIGSSASSQGTTNDPIRIGWMASLTGPLASAAIGINVGVEFAVDDINRSGGINGRKLDLITRDTVGDPNKASNMAKQLVYSDKVDFVIGPVNSGEALATVPLVAKSGVPNIVISAVDDLTNAKKYPRAFRVINTTAQWVVVADDYVLKSMTRQKIALIGDTTGYGAVSVKVATDDLRRRGIVPVYSVLVDPNKTDLSDEIGKARSSGADVIMAWSAATGVLGRLLNARGDAGWAVPVVGHPSLTAFSLKQLLHRPNYLDNVYAAGYLATSYGANGKLPPRTQALVDRIRPRLGGKEIDLLFWWIALGYDAVKTAVHGMQVAKSTDPAAIQSALEKTQNLEGILATVSYGPDKRDGFPDKNMAINLANTFKDGCFRLAPK